jgi:hypothetical protein
MLTTQQHEQSALRLKRLASDKCKIVGARHGCFFQLFNDIPLSIYQSASSCMI